MTVTKGTYYKGLILLIVFGLNMVVSFACSLSNLFHNFHHHNSPAKIEHGVQSNHNHSHAKAHQDSHSTAHSHNHDKAPKEKNDPDTNQSEDDCCSNSVVKMQQVDKSISRGIDVSGIALATPFLATCYQLSPYRLEQTVFLPDNIRWRPPTTIQDLRILIQSFQI